MQSALREIRAHAAAGRAIVVEPYTLARWAQATRNPELKNLAAKNRAVKIQPYTFERWLIRGGSAKSPSRVVVEIEIETDAPLKQVEQVVRDMIRETDAFTARGVRARRSR